MDYDAKFFDLLFALKMVVFKIFWLLTNRVCSHLITPSPLLRGRPLWDEPFD